MENEKSIPSKKASARLQEKEIILLLLQEKELGINLLYEKYSELIYGLIFRIVKSEDLAEMGLQDTFLKIWKRIDTFDPDRGRFVTWFLNIARNTAIDLLRSKNYKQGEKIVSMDQLPKEFSANNLSVRIDHIGVKDMVVDNLESKYSLLIELIYFKGFTYSEASKELNIPLGTVKSRVRKAFTQLRVLLG